MVSSDSKGRIDPAASSNSTTALNPTVSSTSNAPSDSVAIGPQASSSRSSVRIINDRLEWYSPEKKKWTPAVYHDDIRDHLISSAAVLGEYTFEHACGEIQNDITSFHPNQRHWGQQRRDWPDILCKINPDPSNVNNRNHDVELWSTDDGKVILDHRGMPLADFNEVLPYTISSAIEPVFMEAWRRLDKRIILPDIRARMLQNHRRSRGSQLSQSPVRVGTLSMAGTRFRRRAGIISWDRKDGSSEIEAYLRKLYPQPIKNINSVRTFRDLLPRELAQYDAINKEKHMYKRGQSNGLADHQEAAERGLRADRNRKLVPLKPDTLEEDSSDVDTLAHSTSARQNQNQQMPRASTSRQPKAGEPKAYGGTGEYALARAETTEDWVEDMVSRSPYLYRQLKKATQADTKDNTRGDLHNSFAS